jgi:hypothetical protein
VTPTGSGDATTAGFIGGTETRLVLRTGAGERFA